MTITKCVIANSNMLAQDNGEFSEVVGPITCQRGPVNVAVANLEGFLGAGYVHVSLTSCVSGTFCDISASRKSSRVAAISSGLNRSQQVTLALSLPRQTMVLGLILKPERRAAILTLRPRAKAIASRMVVLPQVFGPTKRENSRTRPKESVKSSSSGFSRLPRCRKFSI